MSRWQRGRLDLFLTELRGEYGMARARLLAAFAALTLLSTGLLGAGPAQAQRESEERALRDQFADRDEYRAKLILELQRRQSLLTKQQQALDVQEKRLREYY